MSLEKNKEIVRKFIEAYNNRNLDLLDDLVAPDYFDQTHQQKGLENLKQLMKLAFTAFPDWHETIEDIIAEGDKVWVHLTYTGTFTGEFQGLTPTGNKITTTAVDIYRIVNDKLVEGLNFTNDFDLFKSLGVIESTEEGKKFFGEDVK